MGQLGIFPGAHSPMGAHSKGNFTQHIFFPGPTAALSGPGTYNDVSRLTSNEPWTGDICNDDSSEKNPTKIVIIMLFLFLFSFFLSRKGTDRDRYHEVNIVRL